MFIASIPEGQPVIISCDTEIRKRTGKYMLFTGVEEEGMALDYLGHPLGWNPHCLSSGTVINGF